MEPADNIALAYRNPAQDHRRVFSMTAFLVAAIIHFVVVTDLAILVPRFEPIFESFEVKLPLFTGVLLAVSRWFRDIGWIILLPMPLVIGFAVGMLTKARPPGAPSRKARLAAIVILVVGAIVMITAIALFLPMISLIQGVSSPRK